MPIGTRLRLVITLCAVPLLIAARTTGPVGAIILRCGGVLDPRSGTISRAESIRVADGRIVAISATSADEHASVGATVDLSRVICMPGLIDTHVHLVIDTRSRSGFEFFLYSSARQALLALRNAQTMLRNGFTTIRSIGELQHYYATVDLRDAIERGDFVGPRILVAPHFIEPLVGDTLVLAPELPRISGGLKVSGPIDVREKVRQEIRYGADWIKVMASGSVMTEMDDAEVQGLTDEEIIAAVDEAHRYGKRVAVHAHGTRAIKTAVRAGADSIEHATLIDDDGIELMKIKGTFLVPTLYVMNYVIDHGREAGYTDEKIAKARALQARRNANIRKAFRAGVKVAFGTDTIFPHEQAAREFAAMAELGMSAEQAVQAATTNAAVLLGLQEEIGVLEQGRTADVIAVAEDPYRNLRTLENVLFVMKSGVVVKNDLAPVR
jgi:imidazolonepropionase-like amidohydrolase